MSENKDRQSSNISRRSFLKGAGTASIGVALATGAGAIDAEARAKTGSKDKIVGPGAVDIHFNVNGQVVKTRVEPQTTLVDALRDHLSLTGTKIACNRGACGACTVMMNGVAINSCMTLALDAVGAKIETIEGTGKEKLQEVFVEKDALQCGFCTSGMIMSCKSLLDKNPNPDEQEIKEAVSGNLCRCGTYPKVFEAVKAVGTKKGK